MSYKLKNKKALDEITMLLGKYTEEVSEGITVIANELAKNGVKELKQASPKEDGDYSKSWKIKKTQGSNFVSLKIYNQKHYRLTHLLEYGHIKRNGGRTKAQPHIKPIEESIIDEFESRVVALIKGGKK